MSNNRAMGKLRGVMLQIEHLVDERKRDFRKVMAYIQRVIDDANLCPPAPLRFPFDGPFAERLPKTEEWKLVSDFTSSGEPTIEDFVFEYYNSTLRGPVRSDRDCDARPRCCDAGRQHAEWVLQHQAKVLEVLAHDSEGSKCCDLLFPGTQLIDPDGNRYMLILLYVDGKYFPSHCRVDVRREPPEHPTCKVVRVC